MTEPRTEILNPDQAGIARAAALLRGGRLVAFPTETVYGLGADAGNDRAVAGIFAAKGRPAFNPLIVHVPDLAAARDLVMFSDTAERLASAFWPGPLTLVLPLRARARARARVSKLVTCGLETLAVRVPAHPLAQSLLTQVGRPVAAPSANPSGRISPTTAAHVLDGLGGKLAAVIDGGPAQVGLESTIVECTTAPRLLRPGGLPVEALADAVGPIETAPVTDDQTPTAPGQMSSHYAPRASLRLNAASKAAGEVLLGFGACPEADLNLSRRGDLAEAAANLFAALHELDEAGAAIAVAPIPDHGLGRAVNDRLRRAAAPNGQV